MTVTSKDIELAEKGRKLLRSRPAARVQLNIGQSTTVDMPKPVREVLEKTLLFIAEGQGVVVLPEPTEITTQQAADLLHVSRPFIVKLLENEEIPFRKVGKHRRIQVEDVLCYKEKIDKKRLKVLEKLAAEAQELGLGY